MNYPVVIHKEKRSDYGVTVPDLPGCFSAGKTLDEVRSMAQEAIELHLEGMIDEGLPVPAPNSIEAHQRNADFSDGTWAVVSIDQSTLRVRAKRINITVPERILDAVDRYFARAGCDVIWTAGSGCVGIHGAGQAGQADRNKRAGEETATAINARSVRPRSWSGRGGGAERGLAAGSLPLAGLGPISAD